MKKINSIAFQKYLKERGINKVISPESTFMKKVEKGEAPIAILEKPISTLPCLVICISSVPCLENKKPLPPTSAKSEFTWPHF